MRNKYRPIRRSMGY